MQNLDYILKLFEAKGWYLYEGNPKTSFDRIISRGRALQIKHDAFYHIMPSSGRDDDPTQLAIVPENPSNVLFRGQVTRYDRCIPAASRGLDPKARNLTELNNRDQARMITNLARTWWFVDVLRQTPPLRWMNEQRLFIDEVAVAQHYGLPTGYLDLTQSFEVATFFASCRYDTQTKQWEPVGEGEGVIYAVDWHQSPFRGPVRPIHLQVFPR